VPVQYIEDMANADSPVAQLKYDALGYKPLVTRLLRFIQNPRTKPPLVLAIQAQWGMGKSSVMEMLQTELNDKKAAVSVWFNAWHHQKEDQLLAFLLEAIQKQVSPSWFSAIGLKFRFNLLRVRMFSGVERFLAVLAALLLLVFHSAVADWLANLLNLSNWTQQYFTLNWPVAGVAGLLLANQMRAFNADPQKLVEESTRSLWKMLRDMFVFPTLQGKTDVRQEFARNLKEVTDALLPQRLVIFLDDLDRCGPEQVVQILEAINFLSSAPCFIVVGADYQKVETLAGQHFEPVAVQEAENQVLHDPKISPEQKERLKIKARVEYARVYMRKIVNIRLDLPQPKPEGYARLIRQVGETSNTTMMRWQQAGVWLLMVVFVVLSIAVAAGWIQPPVSKPKPEAAMAKPPSSVEARGLNPGTGPVQQTGPQAQKGAATPARPAASDNTPEDALAVVWNHRLTIAVPLVIALVFLIRLRSRPKEMEKAVDSYDFSTALDKLAGAIAKRCGTPREVRRFQNYLRFLAASDDSAARAKMQKRSGDLVRLAAIGIKSGEGLLADDGREEVVKFYSEQCEMLGLDPETFQPMEERIVGERAASASA
jgi:hypothetical protein